MISESLGDGAIQPDSPPPTSNQSSRVIPNPVVAGNAHRRVVLLRAIDVIGKIIVQRDAIELRRWLILFTPTPPTVERNIGAAVITIDHPVRIVGRDPEIVIVAVWHTDAAEGAAAIV